MKTKSSYHSPVGILFAALAIVVCWCVLVRSVHGQTPTVAPPQLVLSAGTAGQASALTINSDSQRTWKRFAVASGSGGTWSVISAEHGTGDDGGLYAYTISVTATAIVADSTPAPPAPDQFSTADLAAAVTTAAAGLAADQAQKAAGTYDALAKSIDAGMVTSPVQLQLATGTQFLSVFDGQQLGAVKPITAAVNAWLDAQQSAGRLTADRMTRYAQAYHAAAAAIRAVAPAPAPPAPAPARAAAAKPSTPPKLDLSGYNPGGPCANGRCPTQPAADYRRFRR